MNWKLVFAKLEFGFITTSDIPELACQALAEGIDSPAIRMLAGLDPSAAYEITELLPRTLLELNLMPPTREESAWELIQSFVDLIITRQIDPQDALHAMIYKIYYKMPWSQQTGGRIGDEIGIYNFFTCYYIVNDFRDEVTNWDDLCTWEKTKTNKQVLDELMANTISEPRSIKQPSWTA